MELRHLMHAQVGLKVVKRKQPLRKLNRLMLMTKALFLKNHNQASKTSRKLVLVPKRQ